MNDVHTPCMDAPEDWFIEKDGRQYADEPVLTAAEMQSIGDGVIAETGDGDGVFERIEVAIEEATEERLRDNLVKRRHAKDACHVSCYFRTQCLGLALAEGGPMFGTWGGYHQEELRKIRNLRDERAAAHDVDGTA